MSPEQAKGAPVDRRSDIFALGIVLWEMVAMQRLFKAENDLATIQMIINSKATPPSQLRAECTPDLERIILRALEPDLDKRYQTAEEMQVELEELATEHKLKQSTVALRSFMQRMFDAEIQAWKEAQASGLTLTDHVVGNTTSMTTPISESGLEYEPDEEDDDSSAREDDNAATFDPPTMQRDPIAFPAPQSGAMTVQLPVAEAATLPPTAPQPVQFPVAPPSWVQRAPTPVPTEDAFHEQKKRIAIIGAIAFAGIVIIALAFGGSGNNSAAKLEPPSEPDVSEGSGASAGSGAPAAPASVPPPAPAPQAAPAPAPEPPVVAPAAPPAEPPPAVAPPAKPNEPPPHVAPAAPASACNADAAEDKARTAEMNGQHGAALVAIEQAIKCAPTDRRYALAFMSACNAANAAKAKLYFAKIPPANRNMLKQICARNGINLDAPPAAKDKPKKPIDLDSATPP